MAHDFIDEAIIEAAAGDGGNGRVASAARSSCRAAGPTAADGGRGGDVVLVADRNLATLRDQRYQREFLAGRGEDGGVEPAQRRERRGRRRARCPSAPSSTTPARPRAPSRSATSPTHGQRFVAARGGRGGFGNAHFATSTRQTPDFAKPGPPGRARGGCASR